MTLQGYLTRVTWWCVTPLLVLAVGLGYLQFSQARDQDHVEAQGMAKLLARSVGQALQARLSSLQALASSPLFDDEGRWPELHREAQGIGMALGSTVLLVDAQLRVRLHSGMAFGDAPPPLPQPQAECRAVVARAFDTAQPAVSDLIVGPVASQPLVLIAMPVLRAQRAVYVVVNLMPKRQLEAVLGGLPLPPGWAVVVSDGRGQAIAHLGNASGTAGAPGAEGMLRFAERPAATPWSAEVRIPRRTYPQHLRGMAALLLLALLGVTLVSVLGALWATRRLARAVRSLAEPAAARTPTDELEEIRQTRRLLDDARAQREAALDGLRAREDQLRGIFGSASEAILTADPSQTIVLANPAAARVFGRPLEQLIGLPLEQLLPERLRDAHRQHVDLYGRSAGGARAMGGRHVIGLRGDGSEFPMEAAISQVIVDGQRLYTVILRDITESIAAQASITAGKARLEATLESLDEGLAIADTAHRIVEVNAAFVRMLGIGGKASCLRPIAEYQQRLELRTLDGVPLTDDQWSMPRALRGEQGSAIEYQVLHRDSGRRWIGSFSFAPVRDADGHIAGAVFSVRDITLRKQLEDELKASHRDLERLVAAQNSVQEEERKRIARELHDELQQVLAAIKMDIASILPQVAANPAALPALVRRIDDLAGAAITSTRRIVSDLRPQLLEEFGLVAALELLAARFMERQAIRVTLDCDRGSSDPEQPGDAAALCLYRVAQEALNNVAKHARASRVHMRLARTADAGWSLRIADDGRGMSAQDQRKPSSFGLRGMAERLRALGGELSVHSEPGSGAVVTAWIGGDAALHPGP